MVTTMKQEAMIPDVARRRKAEGFTLIELLVVIAIIAILAAMILPALARAKDRAIKATCINNQKEIYISLHIYCDQNQDTLPSIAGGSFWNWDIPGQAAQSMLDSGCTKKTFYCPSTAPRFTSWEDYDEPKNTPGGGNLWDWDGPNYNIIGYSPAFHGPQCHVYSQFQNVKIISEEHTDPGPPPVTFVDDVSSRELLADVMISHGNKLPGNAADNFTSITDGNFQQNGALYPHESAHLQSGQVPTGGMILFKDGHVEWRKFQASGGFANQNVTQVRADAGGGPPYFWW